ncbi:MULTISPECIES: hypothetical protein [unclassified Helicobacter]|uniref:hypothetical protein n=1 Tax=unclassified Helicobacter TaxID=2593540 RepID=UPI001F3C397F|nr:MULTISPECIES: hypothetical protein [unclassified Helicobacter]
MQEGYKNTFGDDEKMKYKVLENIGKFLFDSIYQTGINKKIAVILGEQALDLKILLTNPYITKIDILEYFEYCILQEAQSDFEIDEGFMGQYDIYPLDVLSKSLFENDPKPSYASEYIGIIGECFLGNLIDFTCKDEKRSLSCSFDSPFEAWKYFKEIFFYQYQNYLYDNSKKEEYSKILWSNFKDWNSWDIGVSLTKKGSKYLEEILEPRFYNKYKDLSVEIDDNGNIIRWIGEINR